jgi:hypothetical protein
MYDTKFIVRYHDIQEELVLILKKEEEERGVPVEYDQYSSQDILDICNKLYRDELSSVFYAEDIMDDKIDKGMKTVFDIMLVNPDFKAIIDKMKELLLLRESKNVELELDTVTLGSVNLGSVNLGSVNLGSVNLGSVNLDTINLESVNLATINLEILLTLFSENIFYITHKCICQQITTGHIDSDLLENLNQNTTFI